MKLPRTEMDAPPYDIHSRTPVAETEAVRSARNAKLGDNGRRAGAAFVTLSGGRLAHRIILADTQVIFRTGAARVLSLEDDLRVVAQCADAAELMASVSSLRSSIVVVASSLPADLHQLLDHIENADSRSVVIVEHGTRLDPAASRRADGVIPRSVTGPELVDCLRQVGSGERCVQGAKEKRGDILDRVGARVLQRLTPKELQIVALVAEGGKNRDIARQLRTKEQVIKNYLRSIYDKTGASDRLELALFTAHHRTLADAARRVREELSREQAPRGADAKA